MKTTSSEIDLFNHEEFGEAYLGMAYHVREMNQLDRMIFEDCAVADGAVVAPHLNVKSRCPVHLRPEILQRRIGCAFTQAVVLADAWSIIEATPKMVDAFIGWVKTKGVEAGVAYFERLAMNLAEVEVSWDSEAVVSLPEDGGDAAGAGEASDGSPEEAEGPYPEEIPDLYAYHVIGYDELAEAMDLTWEERQPRSYKALLRKVRSVGDLEALRDLGKRVYALDLARDQAGVFWYEYGKSRNRLMSGIRKGLGGAARHLLKRIRNANGDLAAVGAMLYRIQQGAVKLSDPPAKHEWIVIWEAYHARQAELRP